MFPWHLHDLSSFSVLCRSQPSQNASLYHPQLSSGNFLKSLHLAPIGRLCLQIHSSELTSSWTLSENSFWMASILDGILLLSHSAKAALPNPSSTSDLLPTKNSAGAIQSVSAWERAGSEDDCIVQHSAASNSWGFWLCWGHCDRLIARSIDQWINQSVNQPIKQASKQSINQSIRQSINQSINQSTNQSSN